MKIYILGSNGMLGRYVYKYFKHKNYNVVSISKNQIDASLENKGSLKAKLFHLGVTKNDVIINCIGTIKPRVDELGKLNAIQVNSVFPLLLDSITNEEGIKFIHPTTDCVFTGNSGKYNENDQHDVTDIYGRSKSLGEPEFGTVIRTSIIGEEINQGRSLVEWIKSNKDKEVNGFTNHHWNGITCLQFAKICEEIIQKNLFWCGIKHLYSPTSVTKEELVNLISDIYELNIKVNPKEAPYKCDRTLSTTKQLDINIPELREQIIEMKNFYIFLKD